MYQFGFVNCEDRMNGVGLKLIICMVCLVWQLVSAKQHVECIQRERIALLHFKSALIDRYGMLSSWTTPDCCQWKGIRCSNLTSHVFMLHIHGESHDEYAFNYYYISSSRSYVSGEIHKSLTELQHLNYLNLSGNHFQYRHIPEFLPSLPNLISLDLSSCGFGGKIPTQFGSLSHLKYLNLALNLLEGSIPPQLGNLSRLQHLDLRGNHIEGKIPSQLGNLSELQYLYLSDNYMEGKIPSQLGNISKLQYLDLSYNSFEGNIPSQLGNLSNLRELYLGGYYGHSALKIDDGYPDWLSNLISLTHLYLFSIPNINSSHNYLKMIAKLPKLRQLNLIGCSLSDHFIFSLRHYKFNFSTSLSVLDLSGNTFTSSMIFEWLSNSTSNLVELDLSHNLLEDSKSNHFGMAMNSLKHLDLSYNSFNGGALISFANICTLHSLNMNGNNLATNLASFLHNLSNGCVKHSLQELNLAFNQIIGSLCNLSKFSSLTRLDLSNNQLSGMIPEGNITSNSLKGRFLKSFGNVCTLSWLDLSYNSLSEELSVIFDHLSGCSRYSLQELNLEENRINGTLFDLSIFSSLKTLILDENRLSGKIPEGNIFPSKLEVLSISSNSLEGGVPKSFEKSCALRLLDLAYNNLSDELSVIFDHLLGCSRYSLQELNLEENKISGTLPDLSTFSSLKLLYLSTNRLSGMIPKGSKLPSQLEVLSISSNFLEGGVPKSFGKACALSSLDLSNNNLTEELPVIFDHLSDCSRYSLQELNLEENKISGTLPDLSAFSSLKLLYLSTNQLRGMIPESSKLPSQLGVLSISSNSLEGGVPKSFGKACVLSLLDLSHNSLTEDLSVIFDHLSGCSRYSLQELNLENNKISGMLPDLSILSSLKILILSRNRLSGKIPEDNILPSRLEQLSIYSNSLEGGVPQSFGNACTLRLLDMSNNSLSEEFSVFIHHLSGCSRYSLEYLDLSINQINGTIPELSMFSSLKELYLYENKLNGDIPKDIQFPPQLQTLNIRSNSLKGVFTDYHFANMSKLNSLDLSDNSLSLAFTQNWIPSFQLSYIGLQSCMLGPSFPKWLQTQNDFHDIDISNAKISDVVPKWFWDKVASLEWISMNISHNNLFGVIPNLSLKNHYYYSLALGSNQFEGPIPPFLRDSVFLDLSGNKFTDSISFLCVSGTIKTLYKLDLSNNQLSGPIPECWSHFKSLSYLDLSHNNFSGKIPTSMGSLSNLQALLLRNNSLTDDIPLSLRNCTKLVMLDMAQNKLLGHVPSWIGRKLQKLQILSLRMNHFYGSLPLEICYLRSIQLLDLSLNNLSGQIPACIKNFTSMTQNTFPLDYKSHRYFINTSRVSYNYSYDMNAFLMWKGSEQMFKSTELLLLKSIDLSSNHFSAGIPIEIENLFEMISLNLSRNNLTGKIPPNIGKLSSLEFLDLSRNQLNGSIPPSLTHIYRLTMLDLSHNHLTGEIPTSTQLQSFNASCYEDNSNLCGPPLEKLCTNGESAHMPKVEVNENENSFFSHEFYLGMTFGFAVSFWVVFASISFKHYW